jgi:S1-C subfamily serine protease
VYSYGCATGIFGFLSSGFVLDNSVAISGNRKSLMTSAPGWFGQSGGVLLNEHGEVIGLTVSVYSTFHHIQLSPTTKTIREFVQAYRNSNAHR